MSGPSLASRAYSYLKKSRKAHQASARQITEVCRAVNDVSDARIPFRSASPWPTENSKASPPVLSGDAIVFLARSYTVAAAQATVNVVNAPWGRITSNRTPVDAMRPTSSSRKSAAPASTSILRDLSEGTTGSSPPANVRHTTVLIKSWSYRVKADVARTAGALALTIKPSSDAQSTVHESSPPKSASCFTEELSNVSSRGRLAPTDQRPSPSTAHSTVEADKRAILNPAREPGAPTVARCAFRAKTVSSEVLDDEGSASPQASNTTPQAAP